MLVFYAMRIFTIQDIFNYTNNGLNLVVGQETISKTQCDEQ